MIYQKTVPPPIFNIIMEMTSLDVSAPPSPKPSSSSAKLEEDASDDVVPDEPSPEAVSHDWETLSNPTIPPA